VVEQRNSLPLIPNEDRKGHRPSEGKEGPRKRLRESRGEGTASQRRRGRLSDNREGENSKGGLRTTTAEKSNLEEGRRKAPTPARKRVALALSEGKQGRRFLPAATSTPSSRGEVQKISRKKRVGRRLLQKRYGGFARGKIKKLYTKRIWSRGKTRFKKGLAGATPPLTQPLPRAGRP